MSETAPCEQCGEVIDTDIHKCPECGNHPAKTAKWSCVGLMAGGLILTAIFWPAGVVLFLLGLIGRIGMYRVDYSPTEYAF